MSLHDHKPLTFHHVSALIEGDYILHEIDENRLSGAKPNLNSENRLFRKTVKPSFTDKTLPDQRITLVENNKVVSDERKLEIFSTYFGNIVQNQGIDGLTNISSDNDAVTIRKDIEKYQK